jgi:hypothetical protein
MNLGRIRGWMTNRYVEFCHWLTNRYLGFFQLSPFRRFLIGFGATLVAALFWSMAVLIECAHCSKIGWSSIKHQMTFGVVHHVFFPAAIGLFTASISQRVLLAVDRRWLALLLVLELFVPWIYIQVTFPGHLQPYEMQDPCIAVQRQQELRDMAARSDPKLEPERNRYFADFATTWRHVNAAGVISSLLTCLLLSILALFIWYCIIGRRELYNDGAVRTQFGATLLLLVTWIPARMYADWYIARQESFWPPATPEGPPVSLPPQANVVLIGGIFAIMVFVFLLVLAMIKKLPRDIVMAILGLVATCLSFFLAQSTAWWPAVNREVDNLPISALVAICVVAASLIIGLIAAWFEAWRPSAPTDDPVI